MIRGLDVAHFQGAVNWGYKKAQYGLSFGAAKCTEGVGFFDTQYVANREGCHRAGMPFIAYHFADPGAGSALTQARRFVQLAGKVEGYCLDLETSSLGQSETNAWMRQFGDDLTALVGGATTIAYLGGYAANGSGQSAVSHFQRWWYPHYWGAQGSWPTSYAPHVGGNTTGWKVPPAPHLWQFSAAMGGMDADVSDLTVTELFSGAADMPLTPADIQAIWDYGIVTKRDGSGNKVAAAAYLSSIDVNVTNLPTAAEIAAAVKEILPPGQGGTSPTADEIATAVVTKFATKLGGTP